MRSLRTMLLLAGLGVLCPQIARAGLSFTCDSSVDAAQAGTCAYLNTTIAGLYNNTFSNIHANIYIEQGITGLGQSTVGYANPVTYTSYRNSLIAASSGSALDTAAIASLPVSQPSIYGGGNIELTSALAKALGYSFAYGTTAGGAACFVGTAGCYNGIVTITTLANLSAETGGTQTLYYRQTGGAQPSNAYDYYSIVQHETNEILGASSCVSTGGGSLTNGCAGFAAASAADLFRYKAPGTRVFIDPTPGAYFSYDGGATNGAAGAVYNTLANGHDYADFASSCSHVQDAQGCLGQSFDITSNGGAEIGILDAIGYNRVSVATPEPLALACLLPGTLAMARLRRRRSGTV